MAYDYFATNQKDEKDDDSSSSAQNLGPQGAGAITSDGQDAPKTDSKSGSSGEFTNLQSYLDANSNTNFGAQVAGKVQGDIDAANQIQKNDAGAFQGQVDQNTVKDDADLRNSALSDPSSFVNDPAQMAAFTKMRDAKYQGPTSFAGTDLFSDADNATKRASEEASLSGSDSGRGALLDKFYGAEAGRSDYTPGQRKLDQLLVANDPNSRAAFAPIEQNGQAVAQNFQGLSSYLDQYAGDAATQTQGARTNTRNALGIDDAGNYTGQGPINDVMTAATGQADKYNTDRTSEYNTLKGDLSAGHLSDAELAKTGIKAGTRTYGYAVDDPTSDQFLQQANAATAGTAATKDQQARVDALSKLAGLANTFLPDAKAAGSYDPTKAVTFDTDGFGKAQKIAEAQYNTAISNAPVDQFQNSGGTFDPNTGAATGHNPGMNINDELANRLNLINKSAYDPKLGYYGDPAYRSQYDSLIDKLNDLQKQYGYNTGINVTPTTNKHFGQ